MRGLAGDRGIDAARDAREPAGASPPETSDQAKRRKLRRAKTRVKGYLTELRRSRPKPTEKSMRRD
jgi:hypothetical protein